ncbi:unnamed protein product, partial [Symbiodinium necroappetens]
ACRRDLAIVLLGSGIGDGAGFDSVSQELGSHAEEAAWHQGAADVDGDVEPVVKKPSTQAAEIGSSAEASLKQRWETGFGKAIFGRSEDQLRAAALARIKEIVLFDPNDSAAAPTSLAAFISAWRFFHYTVGSDADPSIVSQRVEGNDVYAVIAGFALFCLFSAARWSDAAKASGLSIDSHGQADDQTTFMPLIALGHTFQDLPWEILHGDEFDQATVAKVTTHPLKATPLSWATKSGRFDKHEKRILGHHSSPDERMIVTYGRDVMCPVLAKLQHVIDLIRAGRFDPDQTRAERMSSMVMRLNEEAEIDVQPERRVEDLRRLDESEQSDVFLEDHERLNEHPSLVPGLRDDPEPPETGSYVRHKVSLIVHILMVPASLLRCGRPFNHNYEDCSFNPDQPREDILCEQCKAARASV